MVRRIMLPYILVASERGIIAAMMRFRLPGMWVARLAERAARPSATHCLVAIDFMGILAGSKPLAAIMGVSVAPGEETLTCTPTCLHSPSSAPPTPDTYAFAPAY